MSVKQRLQALNITLPQASAPVANYVPYILSGKQILISGQIPVVKGSVEGYVGKVGQDLNNEEAKEIAKICALNIIAQVNEASHGRLDEVRCLKLGVFVNCTEEFTQHSDVANGASDLMVEIFGEKGKHVRFAVGASSLPRGVAVEIEAIFELI